MAKTSGEKVGFPIRFVAFLIDILILGLAGNLLAGLLGGFSSDGVMYSRGNFLPGILGLAYFVFMDVQYGATIGKMAMKIKVVDAKTGGKLTWASALMRELVGRLVNSLTLTIGYLWVLWDENKQGLHDKIGGTYVVKA